MSNLNIQVVSLDKYSNSFKIYVASDNKINRYSNNLKQGKMVMKLDCLVFWKNHAAKEKYIPLTALGA